MNEKIITVIILLLALIVAVFLIANNSSSPNNPKENIRQNPPEGKLKILGKLNPNVELKDLKGNSLKLGDLEGKYLVINSWANWCSFCREELVNFAELQAEFKKDVLVVAVNRQDPLEKVKSFADEAGITSKILILLDPTDSFYRSIGGFTMPETVFVDTSGNIRIHKRGPMRIEEMREKTKALLNASAN
jgi:peroxiredoxin